MSSSSRKKWFVKKILPAIILALVGLVAVLSLFFIYVQSNEPFVKIVAGVLIVAISAALAGLAYSRRRGIKRAFRAARRRAVPKKLKKKRNAGDSVISDSHYYSYSYVPATELTAHKQDFRAGRIAAQGPIRNDAVAKLKRLISPKMGDIQPSILMIGASSLESSISEVGRIVRLQPSLLDASLYLDIPYVVFDMRGLDDTQWGGALSASQTTQAIKLMGFLKEMRSSGSLLVGIPSYHADHFTTAFENACDVLITDELAENADSVELSLPLVQILVAKVSE